MHLSIASPTPKDNGDFTEQSWGKNIDFTFISCTSPWEINKNLQVHTSIPGVGSGWESVDHDGWRQAFMEAVPRLITFDANYQSLNGNLATPSWKIDNLDRINLFYSNYSF